MTETGNSRRTSHRRTRRMGRNTPASGKSDKPTARAKPRANRRLTRTEIETFRQVLARKTSDLLGDMVGMEEALGNTRWDAGSNVSDTLTGQGEAGTGSRDQEVALRLLAGERTLLREMYQALRRIANGTYGICLATGKRISKARLTARPWAKYCIEYAQMRENGSGRPGRDEET